jgi:hypothetical protein
MTFSEEQQQQARKLFIDEYRQKPGALPATPFSSAGSMTKPMADYDKLKREEADLRLSYARECCGYGRTRSLCETWDRDIRCNRN